MLISFSDSRIAGPDHGDSFEIEIENGLISTIESVDRAAASDCVGIVLFGGFIDVHCHGAVGVDVNTANAEELIRVGEFLASKGVTAWLPTLVPDSDENYRRVIKAVDELMVRQSELPIAQALGVHYEGVFASEQMCGALRPQYFKKFTGTEIDELPRLTNGIHMMTLAPEVEGGVDLTAELVRRGWIVSIGHTKADTAILDAAYAAGARHMTHFFNAMTGIHHRELGVAGWGLSNSGVTFDIIADGVHVHRKILESVCRSKSPDKVSLISDSVAPTGLCDGEFELWGETIRVTDGRTQNERGRIAGSVCSMHDCVMMMRSLGFTDAEIGSMSSGNPALLLGVGSTMGSVEVGKRADLVALNKNGDIKIVMVGGMIVPN